MDAIYLAGINVLLKPNDPLLFVFGDGTGAQDWRRVAKSETQPAQDRTKVTWQHLTKEPRQTEDAGAGLQSGAAGVRGVTLTAEPATLATFVQTGLIKNLTQELSLLPWSSRYLAPDTQALWATSSASVSNVLVAVDGRLKKRNSTGRCPG